ncbi:hypothetical protein COCON_G00148400 [Conger conger]|uniref:Polyprotein n=1 Tax=Conger conger TaxID=82655 RepID=A0A9Q1DC61_CONCO|nr:hypothetical protein COCON_G00148400 [Conger conger]
MKGWYLSHPIIGFNVIEHILTRTETTKLHSTVRKAFPSLKRNKVGAFIKAVSAEQEDEYTVKTNKEGTAVSKRSIMQISCRVAAQPFKEDTTMLFQPDQKPQWPDDLEFYDTLVTVKRGVLPVITIDVSNPTDHDIVFPGRTVIVTAQTIMTVLPVQIFENVETPGMVSHTNVKTTSNASEQWDPPVDLSHLCEDQRQLVKPLLRQQCKSFSKSDDDIGYIEKLHMTISIKDTEPVKCAYSSVPNPLYQEMKGYLHDLIAQGLVRKSNSSYSSPVVCVRKRDGTLDGTLQCIDYRDLNSKTHPDRQPIPQVQDILSNLGEQRPITRWGMVKWNG